MTSQNRRESFNALQAAQVRTGLAETMRSALLQGAVAIRNMGLAAELDVVNKQEKLATRPPRGLQHGPHPAAAAAEQR